MAKRSRNRSAKEGAYRTLTPADLRGFDKAATDLIMAAMNAGAVGKLSNRGHVILRGPDGATTAVSRNLNQPNRGGANAKACVRRLIKALEAQSSTTGTNLAD